MSFAILTWRLARPPATPLTSLSPALTELPTAVLTLAFRQTQFMLKEWGSEFSPRKLGALEQPQEESSRQLSTVGAGATVLCLESLRVSKEDKEPDSEEEWQAGRLHTLLGLEEWKECWARSLEAAAAGSSVWGPWHLKVEQDPQAALMELLLHVRCHSKHFTHVQALLSKESADKETKAPTVTC